jgi:hypothetical protein
MAFDTLSIPFTEFYRIVGIAEKEIIQRLKLKRDPRLPDYPGYYFVKKNSNRYFRKHLGFTHIRNATNVLGSGTIIIHDYKKLMLFFLKYNLWR